MKQQKHKKSANNTSKNTKTKQLNKTQIQNKLSKIIIPNNNYKKTYPLFSKRKLK